MFEVSPFNLGDHVCTHFRSASTLRSIKPTFMGHAPPIYCSASMQWSVNGVIVKNSGTHGTAGSTYCSFISAFSADNAESAATAESFYRSSYKMLHMNTCMQGRLCGESTWV